MPTKPSISFVVPSLNESQHIERTVATILEAVGTHPVSDYEIILVNDGSTDNTGQLADQLASRFSKVRALHNERNLGFGGAYKRGISVARNDYIMIIAGDNIMPASAIREVLGRLGEADIILPYMTDAYLRTFVRRVGSRGFTILINMLFGLHVQYYNSLVPRRELLNKMTLNTDGYALPAECVVKLVKAGYTYTEVGVEHGHTARTGSDAMRLKNLANVFRAVFALVREVRRPGAIPQRNVPVAAVPSKERPS